MDSFAPHTLGYEKQFGGPMRRLAPPRSGKFTVKVTGKPAKSGIAIQAATRPQFDSAPGTKGDPDTRLIVKRPGTYSFTAKTIVALRASPLPVDSDKGRDPTRMGVGTTATTTEQSDPVTITVFLP